MTFKIGDLVKVPTIKNRRLGIYLGCVYIKRHWIFWPHLKIKYHYKIDDIEQY